MADKKEPEVEAEKLTGLVIVKNTSEMSRVWPDLQTALGNTLALAPGEEALMNADPGEVAHLAVRAARPKTQEVSEPS